MHVIYRIAGLHSWICVDKSDLYSHIFHDTFSTIESYPFLIPNKMCETPLRSFQCSADLVSQVGLNIYNSL